MYFRFHSEIVEIEVACAKHKTTAFILNVNEDSDFFQFNTVLTCSVQGGSIGYRQTKCIWVISSFLSKI